MQTFSELAASRRQWINEVLEPWCRQACRRDLRLAEQEWQDLAGRPDPAKTLWFWAWGRFPALVTSELQTLNETFPVQVQLKGNRHVIGYPDARQSAAGQLVLVGISGEVLGPYSIDDIEKVEPAVVG